MSEVPTSRAAPASPSSLREAARVFLRHPSPRILLGAFAIAATLRMAAGGFGWVDLAIAAGIVLLWPLQEWLIHVLVLHYRPMRVLGRELDFRVPRQHRAHHERPEQLELVFIPLHSFAITIPLLVGSALLLAPSLSLALSFLCVYLALAIHYEWVHLLVHTHVNPRSRYYRRLFRNHRLHHFKNERFWYGVTMLQADRILRTAPSPADVPTSPTARML